MWVAHMGPICWPTMAPIGPHMQLFIWLVPEFSTYYTPQLLYHGIIYHGIITWIKLYSQFRHFPVIIPGIISGKLR